MPDERPVAPEHPGWIFLLEAPFFLVGYTLGDLLIVPWPASVAAVVTGVLAWVGLWHRVKRADVESIAALLLEGFFPTTLFVLGYVLALWVR